MAYNPIAQKEQFSTFGLKLNLCCIYAYISACAFAYVYTFICA